MKFLLSVNVTVCLKCNCCLLRVASLRPRGSFFFELLFSNCNLNLYFNCFVVYFSCRARFPLPVIFYRGKYICRSATLSGGPEIYSRTGFDYLFCGDNTNPKPNMEGVLLVFFYYY